MLRLIEVFRFFFYKSYENITFLIQTFENIGVFASYLHHWMENVLLPLDERCEVKEGICYG
jgi:hypothetical protein